MEMVNYFVLDTFCSSKLFRKTQLAAAHLTSSFETPGNS